MNTSYEITRRQNIMIKHKKIYDKYIYLAKV